MTQQTIKNSISVIGKGLHSGKEVKLTFRPAPENTGIVFKRTDLKPEVSVQVNPDRVQETMLCTMLVEGNVKIATIEHVLSALSAMGIDNIYLDLNAEEVPILDGSASPYIFLIESAGIVAQSAPRKYLKIKKTIRVEQEDKFVEISPYNGFHLKVSIDFNHPAIANTPKEMNFEFSGMGYTKELARARTFGFATQLEQLHAQGLALGASLENAVGLDDKGVINEEGLRFPDEFVKHKMLDAIGDLYSVGPIKGSYNGHKPSHAMNNRLLRKILADKEAFEYVEA
ncbi:MAG: UDP-3-O-acyl-N-acetylglucosamine deacetylase [Gammaproteobacteria bacterium]|jgi:UDP-3-O-[3-hydroxymyristoyl] N-acetylglucosamine deacetylase|nr:UDP-3-O-acyl-N-acetylglucosamine deacetylase [Gammaproteobacteria bacterium]